MSGDKVTILICGGGNGAHVHAGIAASQPNTEARVLTLFADEAERWSKALEGGTFKVNLNDQGKLVGETSGKPTMVTKDPAKAMPGVNVIAFVVPAFAHQQYLEVLEPYIQPGTVIAGVPGQAGFEFSVRGILKEKAKSCTIMNYESLPWACRIKEFGKEAEVIGTKHEMLGAVLVGTPAPARDGVAMLQQTLGKHPILKCHGHLLGMTFMGTNAYIHPSIMFGRWHDWDGKPVDEAPLFYQGLDQFAADIMSSVSDDVVSIAKGIMAKRSDIDLSNVNHVWDWYKRCYKLESEDQSTLLTTIKTNRAYKGLVHPTVTTDDGKHKPNFGYRYITEDIPFGLVVMRGVAEVAGVPTPNIDKIIRWAEGVSGKEYFKDGKIAGKDVKDSRSPQKFNLTTLEDVLGC